MIYCTTKCKCVMYTLHYTTLHCTAPHYTTTKHNTTQRNTAQHNMVHYNMTWYDVPPSPEGGSDQQNTFKSHNNKQQIRGTINKGGITVKSLV